MSLALTTVDVARATTEPLQAINSYLAELPYEVGEDILEEYGSIIPSLESMPLRSAPRVDMSPWECELWTKVYALLETLAEYVATLE